MKRLSCEMCGGIDLVKDGGVFVCQHCGTKYSVEEAKKMMLEGTVEVTGTVKVDNSNQINNIRKMADDAYQAENYEEAGNSYNRLLELVPNDYDALFKKGLCLIKTSKLDDIKSEETINYSKISIKEYDLEHSSYEEQGIRRVEMALELNAIGLLIGNAAVNYINENWKVSAAHTNFWNIAINAVKIWSYSKSLFDENDEYLLCEDADKIYKTICQNTSWICNEICRKRKYVSSIVDGGIFGPAEVKTDIWLNDNIAQQYRQIGSNAMHDIASIELKIEKKKEEHRLLALKENPEALEKRLAELALEKISLQKNVEEANLYLNELEKEKKAQEEIQNTNKFKLFGDAAKIKKAAVAKISELKQEIEVVLNKRNNAEYKLKEIDKELRILS